MEPLTAFGQIALKKCNRLQLSIRPLTDFMPNEDSGG
jgi:hypothetical protein